MGRTVVFEGEAMVGYCFGFEFVEIEMKVGEETSLFKLNDLKRRLRMRRSSTERQASRVTTTTKVNEEDITMAIQFI